MAKVKITNPNNVVSYKSHEEFVDVVMSCIPKTRIIIVRFLAANEKLLEGEEITGEDFSLKFKGFTFKLED